ncbi:MAG TPA: ABC transporter substrate-binding protein, partial [Erwinia persicina]|nr:ABC transporter substrate-binding protein [Erwinia persicina]
MNRRDFIKTTGALSVAAACSSLPLHSLWAAETVPATPKKGGHLIVGMDNGSSTDRLDPAFWFESYMYFVGSQLFNCLAEVDENGKITPSLAERWETSDGSRTWVLTIRQGVQFHDGRSLTAKDVVYSLNHHRDEKSSSSVKGYLEPVVSLEATAPHQVTIKLKEPNVEFIA